MIASRSIQVLPLLVFVGLSGCIEDVEQLDETNAECSRVGEECGAGYRCVGSLSGTFVCVEDRGQTESDQGGPERDVSDSIRADDSVDDLGSSGRDAGASADVLGADRGLMPVERWSFEHLPEDSADALQLSIPSSADDGDSVVQLHFKLSALDVDGHPSDESLAGYQVSFEQTEPLPGAALSVAASETDRNGIVGVRLMAGGHSGRTSVRASVEVRGERLEALAGPVVISDGRPSGSGLSVWCESPVLSAFVNRPEPDRWIFAEHRASTPCQAQVSDRGGGAVSADTVIAFLSEAGLLMGDGVVDGAGLARTIHQVGEPPPMDTETQLHEGVWDARFIEGPYNPRDGLVTIIALVAGQEAFVDVDGDGLFTVGIDYQEAGHDLSEPFVDANDNGRWDDDGERAELYRDTNGDGRWTQPNGAWDGDTTLWASTRVLWVGDMQREAGGQGVTCQIVRGCSVRPLREACADVPADFHLEASGELDALIRANDRNGNCLAGGGQGRTSVTLDGELRLRSPDAEIPTPGSCFEDGDPFRPVASVQMFTVGAPDFPVVDPEPVIETVTLSVEYLSASGDVRTESHSYRICR